MRFNISSTLEVPDTAFVSTVNSYLEAVEHQAKILIDVDHDFDGFELTDLHAELRLERDIQFGGTNLSLRADDLLEHDG